MESSINQRAMELALDYENLVNHNALRRDPLLGLLSEVSDLSGQGRRRAHDKGFALAGQSTLKRLELTPVDADAGSRYMKIVADAASTPLVGMLVTFSSSVTPSLDQHMRIFYISLTIPRL